MLNIIHHIPLIAISVWVFVEVLTTDGHIFAFWGRVLESIHNSRFRFMAKPLGYCGICMTGQSSFWGYIALSVGGYALINHIYFVSLTITSYIIINKWLKL